MQIFGDAAVLTDGLSGGVWERLGVSGIVLVAALYLVKYFISQLDKKDARNNELADRFVTATEKMTAAIQASVEQQRASMEQQRVAAIEQQRMSAVLERLAIAVDRLQERRAHQRPEE